MELPGDLVMPGGAVHTMVKFGVFIIVLFREIVVDSIHILVEQ